MNYAQIWDEITARVPLDVSNTIAEAIAKLPEDVVNFATYHCRYVTVGSRRVGYSFPVTKQEFETIEEGKSIWIIVLIEPLEEKDAHSIIAHEIAHAWLGHKNLVNREEKEQQEIEASNLAKEWGFKGCGADPTQYERADPL